MPRCGLQPGSQISVTFFNEATGLKTPTCRFTLSLGRALYGFRGQIEAKSCFFAST